jgi:HSP20 family protein
MKVKSRRVDNVLDEIEAVQHRIMDRAASIFRERGGAIGHALEDWLKAEQQTVWRPAMEVVRTKDGFAVEAAVAGVDPRQLDVQVTPTELLITADLQHSDTAQDGEVVLCEFAGGPLFRSYRFPEPVDPTRASADCRNGMLRITVPRAMPAAKVAVKVA